MTERISDTVVAITLDALLPNGLDDLSQPIVRALASGDDAAALRLSNEAYARTQGSSLVDVLVYAVLLTYRELCDEALGVLRHGFRFHADDVSLQLAQVEALLIGGEEDSAYGLMEALSEVPMQRPRHWEFLGNLAWEIGDRDLAWTAYEAALARGTTSPGVVLRLADLHAEAEHEEEAAALLEKAGRLAPDEPQLWFAVCESWMSIGDWERAKRAAQRCVRLVDHDADAWGLLGVVLREAGELVEALNAFRRARTLAPDEPVHWLNQGDVQLAIGHFEEARQSYQKALQIDPHDHEAMSGMIAAACELGDLEDAARLARRAVDIAPDDPGSWYNLGVVALALRQSDVARTALEEAQSLDEDNPHLLAALATAMLLDDEVEEALAMLETALSEIGDDAAMMLDFTQVLFRHGGAQRVLDLLERVECEDPIWDVVVPAFEYLARALRRDPGFATELVTEFVRRVRRHPEVIPVMWDFEELERLSFALEDDSRETFLAMLAVLDGREDVDTLRSAA